MSAILYLDELKREYIGKTFWWLTVLDVIRTESGVYKFRCRCKCGIIKDVDKRYVLHGRTKSCGCYQRSKEKAEKYSQWCKNNPDKVKSRANKLKEYYKNHPDKLIERGKQHSEWLKSNDKERYKLVNWHKENPELSAKASEKRSQWSKDHPDLQKKINEKVSKAITDDERKSRSERRRRFYIERQDDAIEMNKRISETVSKIWKNSPEVFTSNCTSSSKAEQEIASCISTFYTGELIKNSHSIIAPLELDLYYPEKKIAIEFNGNYWHDENHKPNDYHLNKFKACLEKDILLVSIFESDWNNRRCTIIQYTKDLFNEKDNILSFSSNNLLINNNYPPYSLHHNYISEFISDYYIYDKRNIRVFTCGYSKINSNDLAT